MTQSSCSKTQHWRTKILKSQFIFSTFWFDEFVLSCCLACGCLPSRAVPTCRIRGLWPELRGFPGSARCCRFNPGTYQLSKTARQVSGQRAVEARSKVREKFKELFEDRAVQMVGFRILSSDDVSAGRSVFQK